MYESNIHAEWIAFSVTGGLIVILLIVFCCVKPVRQNCAKCIKTAVGFERASKHAENIEKTKSQECLPKILITLCALWDLLGFASVVCAVAIMSAPQMFQKHWESASRNVPLILFLGILTVILSSFGLAGARATGPTLKMCFYFYILICILLILILFVVCWFFVNSLLQVALNVIWDSVRFVHWFR